MYPTISEADISVILHTIPDCMCLTLWLATMENEGILEDLMPEEEVPPGEKVATDVLQIKPLQYDQNDMIVSLPWPSHMNI